MQFSPMEFPSRNLEADVLCYQDSAFKAASMYYWYLSLCTTGTPLSLLICLLLKICIERRRLPFLPGSFLVPRPPRVEKCEDFACVSSRHRKCIDRAFFSSFLAGHFKYTDVEACA